MPTQPTRTPKVRALEPPTWRQLIAVARTTVTGAPDYSEWKGRLVEKLIALGFQVPAPSQLYRAMDYNAHLLPRPLALHSTTPQAHHDPTAIPRTRDASGRQAMATLQEIARSTLTATVCGCSKPVCGSRPLTCTRAPGHDGDHGMGSGTVLFVRWARTEGE